MKQDSIQFTLTAEEVVVNTTVKITAAIVAMVTSADEQKLKDDIREVAGIFIPGVAWQFSGMTRTSHPSGMEQINLTATARVPESENYALDRRKDEASRDGLRIHSVQADTEPTMEQKEATESRLRQKLLQKAQAELATINATMGKGAVDKTYRIGKVIFDPPIDAGRSNRMVMAASASYGSGFDAPAGGGASDIGNAVKLSMRASVILRI